MTPSQPLADRVAIITGATQGIGLGIAETMARAGAKVVIADIAEDRLAPACAAVAREGNEVASVKVDVTDLDSVNNLVAVTLDRFARIDVLVNNAGVVIVKSIDDQNEADWDRVVDVNLKGTYLCTRAVIPTMSANGGGAIINLCSIAAFGFTTPHVPYTASKAGIVGLTRDVAYEVAARGIRVNAIAPGPIETPMFDALTAAQKQAHAAKVPVGRLGQPEDVGAAAVFLASDAASFITGVTLPVAGGSDLKIS